MIIPCDLIRNEIQADLLTQTRALKRHGLVPKLLAVLVGDDPAQHSYVRMKRKIAGQLEIDFVLMHLAKPPEFHTFLHRLTQTIHHEQPTGVIVQLPLPEGYDRDMLYQTIGSHRDIEGHNAKSHYIFPLVQACMIGLTWSFHYETKGYAYAMSQQYMPPLQSSESMWQWLRKKRMVIAGRGLTTGAPIASYFDMHEIPYTQTHARSTGNERAYKNADIIITGVGKHILHQDTIKQGVILLNFGLHPDDNTGELVGDYHHHEIAHVASLHTITPGGLGPLDIVCLYGNLIQATRTSRGAFLN